MPAKTVKRESPYLRVGTTIYKRVRQPLSSGAQKLLQELIALDFNDPQPFTVRGGDLMQLEQILYRFIVYQIDKPLKSLSFLAQLGL